ncbi:MAG: TetR/AcrR family transcriptional regulator [Vulcanimicrobiota bacterium]
MRFGFEGLTTRQLAQYLGISTGKLYHYFSSKEALFEAACRYWMQRDIGFVRSILEQLPGPAERIRFIPHLLQEHRLKFDSQNQLLLQFSQIQQQKVSKSRPSGKSSMAVGRP